MSSTELGAASLVPYADYLNNVKRRGLVAGQFVQIPQVLVDSPGLPHGPFRLWTVLASHVKYGGTTSKCFAGLDRLASLLGRTDRQVRRDRSWLVKKGLISFEKRRRRTYYKLFVPLARADSDDANLDRSVQEKGTDSSTDTSTGEGHDAYSKRPPAILPNAEVEPSESRALYEVEETCFTGIIEELQATGISPEGASALVDEFGVDRAQRAIAALRESEERGRYPRNPAGFVTHHIKTDGGESIDLIRHLQTRRKNAEEVARRHGWEFSGRVDDAETLLFGYGTKTVALEALDSVIRRYRPVVGGARATDEHREFAECMVKEAVDAREGLRDFPFETSGQYILDVFGYPKTEGTDD